MRIRKLTQDDDYSFGNGLQDFWINVPDAIAESVKTRLLLWLGEWFLNINDGTLYMQGVFGKKGQATADRTIQNRVTSTTGVTKISEYVSTLNPDTRALTVSFKIDTIYGPTQVQLDNYVNY